MAYRYELLVFDWDGTLMDSAGAIVACVQKAACDLDLAPPSEAVARHVIGLGLGEALRYALPELPEERHAELADRYRHHYLARDEELRLFAGARELLDELRASGRRLAVATGKSRHGLERAMAASGLGPLFDATRCADECFSKPHPQMLLELMAECAVPAELTLMIGDTTHDVLMASNAGVDALAVSYGAHEADALAAAAPRACVHSVAELRTWLRHNG